MTERDTTRTEPIGVPWGSRTLQVVFASTLILPLGVPLLSPVLPLFRDVLGLTDARASLLISAYFLPGIVLSPFIGMLADRVGRRRVLVPSLVVFGLAGAAIILFSSFTAVIVLRLVQGVAAAGAFIVTVTLIGDTFAGLQRNAVLGMNVMVLSAGAAAYPLIGGALAPRGWSVPFVLYLVGVPVGLFAYLALDEPAGNRSARGMAYVRGAVAALPLRTALPMFAATFLAELIAFGAILTALPFLLVADFAVQPVVIGGLITSMTVVSGLVSAQNARFARRFTNRRLVAVGFLLYGMGLLGTYLAPTPSLIGVAVMLFGAGFGLILPAVDGDVIRLSPPSYRAGVLSVRNSTTFLGRTLGPVLFAGLAVETGYRPLLLGAAIVGLVVGVAGLGLIRGVRPARRRQI